MISIDYRRAVGQLTWHWNPKCPEWPNGTFECRRTEPVTDYKCAKCNGPGD
jgi:hypothetical protein